MLLSACNCAQSPVTLGKLSAGSAKKPSKLLIVLVIIAMCLSMAAGAPKHRKRHAKARECHHKLESISEMRNGTKGSKHATPPRAKLFAERMHKIQNRLTYTLAVFAKEQKPWVAARRKADWLPKVNFVDIVRNNHGGAIKRFEVLVPKIYKNMRHFQGVFECLQKVDTVNIDSSDPQERKRTIVNHQYALELLVLEAKDGMDEFKRCVPPVEPNCNRAEMEKQGFVFKANQSQRIIQEEQTFKAYIKSLKNWKRAFRCGLPSLKDKVFCRKWRQQFEQRRKAKESRH